MGKSRTFKALRKMAGILPVEKQKAQDVIITRGVGDRLGVKMPEPKKESFSGKEFFKIKGGFQTNHFRKLKKAYVKKGLRGAFDYWEEKRDKAPAVAPAETVELPVA